MLLTELFCACKATTNKAFAMDIRLAKSAWITGKITDKNLIINDLNGLYCNMVADGSWKKVSCADSKIIVLTTQVWDLKKQLGDSDCPKGGGKGKDPKTPTKTGKEVGKNWRYTKVRDTMWTITTRSGLRKRSVVKRNMRSRGLSVLLSASSLTMVMILRLITTKSRTRSTQTSCSSALLFVSLS